MSNLVTDIQKSTKYCEDFGRCNCLYDCNLVEALTLYFFRMDGDHADYDSPRYRRQAYIELANRKEN